MLSSITLNSRDLKTVVSQIFFYFAGVAGNRLGISENRSENQNQITINSSHSVGQRRISDPREFSDLVGPARKKLEVKSARPSLGV